MDNTGIPSSSFKCINSVCEFSTDLIHFAPITGLTLTLTLIQTLSLTLILNLTLTANIPPI